jgi:hypothetical protein
MSVAREEIEKKIRTLLKANAAFNAIKVFFRGIPMAVPIAYYPYCDIFIEVETTASGLTGNTHERVYAGSITFTINAQDFETITDREADITSYTTIQGFVDSCVELFKAQANRDLVGLTFTNGYVLEIIIGDSDVSYGVGQDREDNYTNFGIVPFVVRTHESL